jgi:hypothetical protein
LNRVVGKKKQPKQQKSRTVGRRAFLARAGKMTGLAVVGGAIASKTVAAAGHNASRTAPTDTVAPRVTEQQCKPIHDDLPVEADAATKAFLGPIAAGMALGSWTVARVHSVFHGALPFVLANGDQRVQVDLMAHDAESPRGVAGTSKGQLYVVNSGRGKAFTPQDLVDAVAELGQVLAERERSHSLPLQSFAERHRCHPNGVFVVPV